MDYWLPAAVYNGVPASQRPQLPDELLSSVLRNYLRADVVNTFELAEFYFHELTERHPDNLTELLDVNRQIEHVLWKMELQGVWVRKAELDNAFEACNHYISLLSQTCKQLSGIENITDAKLRTLFFDKWKLEPIKKTKGGQASVDAATLLALHSSVSESEHDAEKHKFFGCYLALKKYEKKQQFLTTYRNVTCKGYLNPSFKSVGTTTTRMSSENPNIQQVTKASNPYEEDAPDIAAWLKASPSMRSVFGPSPGCWWLDCDYSQLQLRIFAAVTQEQEMMDAFDKGWDAHDFVARKIFGVADSDSPTKAQRRIAKNVNFGFIFGASPKRIEKTAGVKGLWNTVLSMFPNAHAFIEQTKADIRARGYIETSGGYPLELRDNINPYTGRLEKAAHAGVNYIVQGTEGVIVKRAMRLCDDYLTSEFPEGRLVLQCHDELVFEAPKYFPKKHVWNLTDLMEQAAADYGVKAPVDPELVTTCWDKSVKVRR
jgi:DNA polymerase-1